MKKIVAIFLLIAITTVFVSCGKGDNDGNQTTLNTNINNIEPTTEGTTEPQGIVLTTDPTKMAQWGYATEFIPTEYTEPTIPTVSVPLISESQLERPTVNISQATVNTSNTTTNNGAVNNGGANGGSSGNNSGPTVSEITSPTEETPTTQLQREPRPISGCGSSISNDRNGRYLDKATVNFRSSGWDGGIVANSGTATVVYAGSDSKVPCSVSASIDSNGYYEIVVTLTGLEIPADTTGFTISFPEGFIKNPADTQYSMAFSTRV